MKKLPRKVVIDFDEIKEEIGDIISGYLSDTYGFCHYGCDYEIKNGKVYCSNIVWDTEE